MPATAFRVLPPDNSEYESGSCAPQQMVAAKCRNGSIATLPVPGWRGSYAPNNDQTGDLPIRRKGPQADIHIGVRADREVPHRPPFRGVLSFVKGG